MTMSRLVLMAALVPLLAGVLTAQDTFRALSLSGRVVLEDGSPPPVPVIVDLRCDGNRMPQYYTNDKGYFIFRIGGEPSRSVADSQRQGPGEPVGATGSDRSFVSLTNCELEATLAGYTSSKIYLARRSVFESTDVGTIVLHRLGKGAGSFASATTEGAPPAARQACERAEKELARERPDHRKAARELQKAVGLDPHYAVAWNLLGKARLGVNDAAGAREAFQKAVEADSAYVPPLVSLAFVEIEQRRLKEAAAWAGKALALAPGLAEAHYYNAVASLSLGDDVAAEASIRMVVGGPQAARFPRGYFILGNILAGKGDVKGAAVEFRRFLELEPASRAAEAVKKQLAEWQAAGTIQ